MKREILYCGHPTLRKKARRVRQITPDLIQLLTDMVETMIEAPGVGLAAPQVGESVCAIVVREDVSDDSEIHCLLNPRIVDASAEQEESVEGCLSFPTLQGIVVRPSGVVVEGMGLDGQVKRVTGEGLFARAMQHEIDHLDGVLFVDRVEKDSLGWMVPDENEENGYRIEPTTLEEVIGRFERLRREMIKGS